MIKYLFLTFFLFAKISPIELPKNLNESGIEHGISWKAYKLKKGDTPELLFGKYAEGAMRFNRLSRRCWREGQIIKKPDKPYLLKNWTPLPGTFEECKPEMRICIMISLNEQFLGVYKKGKLEFSYPISTGMDKKECGMPPGTKICKTPPGSYKIKFKRFKVRSRTYRCWMHYAMHIGNQRYIHFGVLPGYPASHGCIRLFKKDARALFKMTPKGTPVYIINE